MQKKDKRKQQEFMMAYEGIHERFERFCRARAYRAIDQKDLMNEVLCRAYQSWDKLKDKNALLYFLFGTAKNIVLNSLRKKKEVEMNSMDLVQIKTDNYVELDLEIAFLYQQIDRLSEEKKEAILLYEISGFSIKEIAVLQQVSLGAVNMRLKRAREELKELMMDEKQESRLKTNTSNNER